jgi:hypothetical protein
MGDDKEAGDNPVIPVIYLYYCWDREGKPARCADMPAPYTKRL